MWLTRVYRRVWCFFAIIAFGIIMGYANANTLPSKLVEDEVKGQKLTIYLPANYNKDHSYKVVYFLDSQAIWTPEWNLKKRLDDLITSGSIEPIVVVGIETKSNRNSILLPYYDLYVTNNWGGYTPNALAFSNRIHNSVIPYVERKYSVSKSTVDKAYFGFSFGGLHTFWDSIHSPNKWGMVSSLSPSFWIDNYRVFKELENSEISDTKYWMDIGTGEWDYILPAVDILTKKGVKYGEKLFYLEVPNAKHQSQYWSERIFMPLIIFAGNQEYQAVNWDVKVEFISSSSGDKYYKRINPIVTAKNGIKYSVGMLTKYEVLNPDAGKVFKDGSFQFLNNKKLNVKLTYKQFKETVSIKNNE